MTMTLTALSDRYGKRSGERIGSLTFLHIADERGDHNRLLGVFRCDCGAEARLPLGRVLNGKKRTHCGCQTDHGTHRTHGMRYSREYSSWQAMKARCLDPENKDYPGWGGRGITIYEEWTESFEAFFQHIGPRPPGTSIDRIDGRLGYEPGNVRWATPKEQQRNRRGSYQWVIKGQVFETHDEAARHFGVSPHTVWAWAHGRHDHRRNSFTPPREDCHVVPRY